MENPNAEQEANEALSRVISNSINISCNTMPVIFSTLWSLGGRVERLNNRWKRIPQNIRAILKKMFDVEEFFSKIKNARKKWEKPYYGEKVRQCCVLIHKDLTDSHDVLRPLILAFQKLALNGKRQEIFNIDGVVYECSPFIPSEVALWIECKEKTLNPQNSPINKHEQDKEKAIRDIMEEVTNIVIKRMELVDREPDPRVGLHTVSKDSTNRNL